MLAPDNSGNSTTTIQPTGRYVRSVDRLFRVTAQAAAATVLAIMLAITVFLVVKAIPALQANSGNFFTTSTWLPDVGSALEKPVFGIAAMLFHTIVTSVLALGLAVPVAVCVALFITYFAPRRLAGLLGYVVDLLAAVPSIIFGLWGFAFLAPQMTGVVEWLDRYFGWTIVFNYRPHNSPNNLSDFTAGIVLAIMIIPIICAISREVFRQVPSAQTEAALALGATRWEMIRMAVWPFGRNGVVSASILGLGRALGETLAVTLILGAVYSINVHITEAGGVTFASNIALKFGEAGSVGSGALIASGLCLFVITLAVNFSAQWLIRRRPGGAS